MSEENQEGLHELRVFIEKEIESYTGRLDDEEFRMRPRSIKLARELAVEEILYKVSKLLTNTLPMRPEDIATPPPKKRKLNFPPQQNKKPKGDRISTETPTQLSPKWVQPLRWVDVRPSQFQLLPAQPQSQVPISTTSLRSRNVPSNNLPYPYWTPDESKQFMTLIDGKIDHELSWHEFAEFFPLRTVGGCVGFFNKLRRQGIIKILDAKIKVMYHREINTISGGMDDDKTM